uniref:Uncharacterized protein n=1 Tax=Caenorhabditis japonica TaxID=281687 RepID=A0A8R1IJQ6_CAEJA
LHGRGSSKSDHHRPAAHRHLRALLDTLLGVNVRQSDLDDGEKKQ